MSAGYASWTKLRSGDWGVRVEGEDELAAGTVVATRTRAGKISAARIASKAWSGSGVVLYEVGGEEVSAEEKAAAIERAEAGEESKVAEVEASRAVDASVDIPVPDGYELMGFQRAGIAYALARPSTLIADEMGLGKTIQALGLVNADPSVRSVLVIVPASLRLNWLREAKRWLTRRFAAYVVETSDPVPASADLVIVNYDRLIGKHGKAVRESLLAREWDLLVVDEAHMLKNPKAQRTEAVLGRKARPRKGVEAIVGLADRARRRLFLTGTPILNKPMEIHPLLAKLDEATFGDFFRFAKRYCAAYRGQFGWDFSGASNLDELQDRLRRSVMVRRLKSEVLTELPAKRRSVVVLPQNGGARAVASERKAWESYREDLEAAALAVDAAHAGGDSDGYRAAVSALESKQRKAFEEMSGARREVALAKVAKVVEFVREQVAAGEKVVVWAHHHEVTDAIVAGLRDGDEPIGVVSADGRITDATKREEVVQAFQTDDRIRVAVLGTRAMGVGHTLTAGRVAVFAELDWVPAVVTQAEDREHRIGQTESVLVYHLVLDGSIDVDMAEAIVAKQAIADRALDLRRAPETRSDREAKDKASRGPKRATGASGRPEQASNGRPEVYPPATDVERDLAARAMIAIDARCDGVRSEDGMGWSRVTRATGSSLAARAAGGGRYSDGQVWLARKLARTHRRQLSEDLVEGLGLETTNAKGD